MPIKYWTINPSESIWGHNGECNSRIILLVHTSCKSGEIFSNKSHDKLLRFATFSSHVLSRPIHGWRWQWKPEPLRRRLEDYLRSIFNFLIIRKEFDGYLKQFWELSDTQQAIYIDTLYSLDTLLGCFVPLIFTWLMLIFVSPINHQYIKHLHHSILISSFNLPLGKHK